MLLLFVVFVQFVVLLSVFVGLLDLTERQKTESETQRQEMNDPRLVLLVFAVFGLFSISFVV